MNRAVPAHALFAAALLAAGLSAAPAGAQFLASELERTQFDQRLRQPSLRLATLGRLSLAFDDENNEINQWDFGNSPVGLLDDRAGNSVDLFLDSGGRTAERTIGGREREVDRVEGSVYGLSAAARNPGKFAFGIDAGFQALGSGIPREFGTYQDQSANLLQGTVTAGGRMLDRKIGWGARVGVGKETFESRRTQQNAEFDLEGGDALEELSIFDRNEGSGRSAQVALGLGWMASSWGDVTLNWEYTKQTVKGDNSTRRRIYETEEPRGIDVLSLTTTLRPASWVTFGGTVGQGGFDADENYRFTLSLGQGAPPAQSRGDRLSRDVEGEFLRTRLALSPPGIPELLVGADFNVRYRREETVAATGPGSFNDFLEFAERNGFILGAPLEGELQELRHWDAGVGLGYTVSPRLKVGVEGHRANDARDGTLVRLRRRITDLQAGVEYDVSSSWQARVGGWRRGLDDDVFTENNEGVATAITLGAGYKPAGAKFALDGGVEILGRSTDYPDPTDGTGSGFRFVLYNRWSFD
jgi:hypothetical protein